MFVIRWILCAAAICCMGVFFVPNNVDAEGTDWVGKNLNLQQSTGTFNPPEGCSFLHGFVDYEDVDFFDEQYHPANYCNVNGADGYKYAWGNFDSYNNKDQQLQGATMGIIGIQQPGEALPTRIHYSATHTLITVPDTNYLLELNGTDFSSEVDIYQSLLRGLRQRAINNSGQIASYELDNTQAIHIDLPIYTANVGVEATSDSKYVILRYSDLAHMQNAGFYVINMVTGSVESYRFNTAYKSYARPLTNDARYVMADGIIYDLLMCHGEGVVNADEACENRSIDQYFKTHFGTTVNYTPFFDVLNDSTLLRLREPYRLIPGGYIPEVRYFDVTINPRLMYLALGDSYTSGEGTNNSYIYGTNVSGDAVTPTEKCHVSDDSYPYLLAGRLDYGKTNRLKMADNGWATVACSGAKIDDINGRDSSEYQGQSAGDSKSTPRLKNTDYTTLKLQAIEDGVPGRAKQIEFIKKYQPKVLTLTVGGNDVGFGRIINSCVSPNISDGGELTVVCSYAKDDFKRSLVGYSIKNLQGKLVSLYKEILEAGPDDMRLFVIGYPKFIDDSAPESSCGNWVGLTRPERKMIVESIDYLNQVIRYASNKSGAVYISTYTSMGDHNLCGKAANKAVNGIVLNDMQESFHPNSLGHKLMADRVEEVLDGHDFTNYNCVDSLIVSCPGGNVDSPVEPDYFKDSMDNNSNAMSMYTMVDDNVSTKKPMHVTIPFGFLHFMTSLKLVLMSDMYDLGEYRTDSTGKFEADVILPKEVPSGYHTLLIDGTDPNGEAIRLWKIVYVANPSEHEPALSAVNSGSSEKITRHITQSDARILAARTSLSAEQSMLMPKQNPPILGGTLGGKIAAKPRNQYKVTWLSVVMLSIVGIGIVFAILKIWHKKIKF